MNSFVVDMKSVSLDSRHGKESTVQDLIIVEVPEDDENPGDDEELPAFEDEGE